MIRSFDRHSWITAESFCGVRFDRYMGFRLRWTKMRLMYLMLPIILIKHMRAYVVKYFAKHQLNLLSKSKFLSKIIAR